MLPTKCWLSGDTVVPMKPQGGEGLWIWLVPGAALSGKRADFCRMGMTPILPKDEFICIEFLS